MTQAGWWAVAGASLAIAVLAALAEHLRGRRRDLDRVGFVPWTLIQLLAFFAAIIAAAAALSS